MVRRDAFERLAPAGTGPAPTDVLATMLNGLELDGSERVLCIGRAVGYPAALLCHLAREVHAFETESALVEPERHALAQLGTNAHVAPIDGRFGPHPAAPFRAIVVTSAAPELPTALIDQLEMGGRIVIPIGDEGGQLIELSEKRIDTLVSKTLGCCALPLFPSFVGTPSTYPWSSRRPLTTRE